MHDSIYQPVRGEFYVYVLSDPRKNNQPFYVGKGSNERVFDHVANTDVQRKENPHKFNIIRKIQDAGLQVGRHCVWHGESEASALWLERMFVGIYRRICDGGTLTNVTLGGDRGPSGAIRSPETRLLLSYTAKHRRNRLTEMQRRENKVASQRRYREKNKDTAGFKAKAGAYAKRQYDLKKHDPDFKAENRKRTARNNERKRLMS